MFASVERFVLVTTAAWALYTLSAAIVLTTGAIPAFAEVLISIDKSTQRMSVSVDGVPQFEFAVSTGRAGYSTPNGTYHPQRLEPVWFSRVYYNSPMPNSIFFNSGYAIHGSYEIDRLGGPASHGCVRLHPSNAKTLFALVKREGMAATIVVVYGSNPPHAGRPAPTAQNIGRLNLPWYDRSYAPDYGRRNHSSPLRVGSGTFFLSFFPIDASMRFRLLRSDFHVATTLGVFG